MVRGWIFFGRCRRRSWCWLWWWVLFWRGWILLFCGRWGLLGDIGLLRGVYRGWSGRRGFGCGLGCCLYWDRGGVLILVFWRRWRVVVVWWDCCILDWRRLELGWSRRVMVGGVLRRLLRNWGRMGCWVYLR